MEGKYKAYPEYRDSGVEWVGVVPQKWKALRGKFVFIEFSERSENGSEELLSVSEYYGVKPRRAAISENEFLTRAESLVGYKKCRAGDLVMNIMLAWKRALGISNYDGIVSPAYSVFRFFCGVAPQYMHYLLRTDSYVDHFKSRSTGVIDSRLRLYPESFLDTLILLPPHPEQIQIARFLDHETGKIDLLIEKQQELIALLKEKRQAVISHAVTKGLNPQAALKDSGIEWLGQVPEHWEVSPLRFFCRVRGGYAFSSELFCDEGHPVIRIGDINFDGTIDLENCRFVPESQKSRFDDYVVEKGSIVMAMTGATIGKAGWFESSQPVFLNQRVGVFEPSIAEINNRYLWHLLASSYYQEHITLTAFGGAQPNISDRGMTDVPITIPPRKEQQAIERFLDLQSVKFENLMKSAETQITLLQERRTALISAAVTGKIDVRDWEPLPEETT